MGLIVQKYGGSSVGTVDRIKRVADIIARNKPPEHRLIVVVSAMQGETDRLLHLAQEFSPLPDQRELDMLLSTGERVTIALLAIALQERGIAARSFTGRQVGIVTDEAHTNARIEEVQTERLEQALADEIVPIVAGFQGINRHSDVTTLGRGGSDITAIALAAALGADRCDIYTDVDGVYTADPNVVPSARKISRISYEEMVEMASLGAKVLQARSVIFAMKYQVPVRVLSSFNHPVGDRQDGTLVTKEGQEMEQESVSGVTYDRNQAKITLVGVPDQPGIAAKIFSAIARERVVVDMIIQNVGQAGFTDLSFTMPRGDAVRAKMALKKPMEEMNIQDMVVLDHIAKVSIVGTGMRSHSGVAAKMFSCLAEEAINIMMISTSEIKISCVIDAKYTELAVRTLHETFDLAREKGSKSSPAKAVAKKGHKKKSE